MSLISLCLSFVLGEAPRLVSHFRIPFSALPVLLFTPALALLHLKILFFVGKHLFLTVDFSVVETQLFNRPTLPQYVLS